VTADHYFLSRERSTFDGRDVFAPLAGWLSKGIQITKFGDPVDDYVTLPTAVPHKKKEDTIEGEVLYVDHFGNLITNISGQTIRTLSESRPGKKPKVRARGTDIPFTEFYSQAADDGMHCVINSFGYLEIFVHNGNASSAYKIKVGEKVEVSLS
jgi:S-adenosylmethionine hydrolase